MDTETRPRKSRIFVLFFFIVVALVVVGAFTLIERRSQYQALAKETETLAIPTVSVFHASAENGQVTISALASRKANCLRTLTHRK